MSTHIKIFSELFLCVCAVVHWYTTTSKLITVQPHIIGRIYYTHQQFGEERKKRKDWESCLREAVKEQLRSAYNNNKNPRDVGRIKTNEMGQELQHGNHPNKSDSFFPTYIALLSLVYLVYIYPFFGGEDFLLLLLFIWSRRPFVLRRKTIRICLATITLSFHSQQQKNTAAHNIKRHDGSSLSSWHCFCVVYGGIHL